MNVCVYSICPYIEVGEHAVAVQIRLGHAETVQTEEADIWGIRD
jgi:hypothetical protein